MSEDVWREEILDWLLGRLSRSRTLGSVSRPASLELGVAPILRWWLFEGFMCSMWPRGLGADLQGVLAQVERLRRSFHASSRWSDRPDGDVDWPATFALGPVSPRTFVVRASCAGLSPKEHEALVGWCVWLRAHWLAWCGSMKQPAGEIEGWPQGEVGLPAQLERWSFTARRSRWPLLREVVAPTLWASVREEGLVERLPLPKTRHDLFEVYVAMRVLRACAPRGASVRWFPREGEGSCEVQFGSCSARLSRTVKREHVLTEPLFAPSLVSAMVRHRVRVPRYIDLLVRFHAPVHGWQWLLVECKSGGQTPSDGLLQTMAYRRALRAEGIEGPILCWIVCERPWKKGVTWEPATSIDSDGWVFSTVDDVEAVLQTLGVA